MTTPGLSDDEDEDLGFRRVAADDSHGFVVVERPPPEGWVPPPVTEATVKPPPPELKRAAPQPVLRQGDPEMGVLEAFALGATNAFNWGDEIVGAGAAIADTDVGRAAAPYLDYLPFVDPATSFGDQEDLPGRQLGRGMAAPLDTRGAYELQRDRRRAEFDQAERESPKAFMLGQIATETASTALPWLRGAGAASKGKAAFDVASRGKRIAQAAAAGGAAGGFSAWGASEEVDPWEQAKDAAVGAGVGIVAGPLVGEGMHFIGTGPVTPQRARGFLIDREAQRISAAHGADTARRALEAADPQSRAGARTRALILEADDPEALDDSTRRAFEQLTELGPPGELREGARRAPELAQEITRTEPARVQRVADELAIVGPDKATLEAARRAGDPGVADEYSSFVRQELDKLGPDMELLQKAKRGNDPALLDQQTRKISDHYTRILEHADKIEAAETIHKKMEIARAYMQRDGLDPLSGMETADALADELRQNVEEMLSHTVQGTDENRLLKRIVPYLYEYDQPIHMANPSSYDFLAAKWARLDQVKRDLQKMLKNVKFTSPETERLHGFETQLRENLESPALWGEGAAELQRRRNRSWHHLLQLENTKDTPGEWFTTDIFGEPAAKEHHYRARRRGDPSAIKPTLRDAAEVENEPTFWKMGETPDRRASHGYELVSHINPDPELQARAAEMQRSAAMIRDTMDERLIDARAAQTVGRMPVIAQDSSEGARRVLASATDPLPNADAAEWRNWVASRGGDTAELDRVLAQHAAEQRAGREVAAMPQALRDQGPAAQRIISRAGGADAANTDVVDLRAFLDQQFQREGAGDATLAAREPLARIDAAIAEQRGLLAEQQAADAAAREFGAYPAALRDPTRAESLVRGAGGPIPDSAMLELQEWAERNGVDVSELQAILDRRGKAVRAARSLDDATRNLPDPGLMERLAGRVASMGSSLPGVRGIANEAVQAARPEVRAIPQRVRQVAQLEADPNNRLAQEALKGMRFVTPREGPALAGGRVMGALTAGANAGGLVADTQTEGHKFPARVRQLLNDDPAALGPYAARLQQALTEGKLGAELLKLSADPKWKKLRLALEGIEAKE